jgi:hypothetical protein
LVVERAGDGGEPGTLRVTRRGPVKRCYPTKSTYDTDQFSDVVVDEQASRATLTSSAYEQEFVVPLKRLGEALKNLTSSEIRRLGEKQNSCRCHRGCFKRFTPADILSCRTHYLSYPVAKDGATAFIVNEIRRFSALGGLKYYLSHSSSPDTEVCSTFFRRAYGFSNGKLSKCRIAAQRGGGPLPHGNEGKIYSTKRDVQVICRAFWLYFYDLRCQKPNDNVWLQPSNISRAYIYKHDFLPWCKTTLKLEGKNVPGCSSFEDAAKHPDFSHVRKRAKHTHLRCHDCSSISARLVVAIMKGEDVSSIVKEREAHEEAVRDWRVFEESLVAGSRNTPSLRNVFRLDDTVSVKYPHFTNRPRKGVSGHHKYAMVPSLLVDEARQKPMYIYSSKGYPKGANRWCSELFLASKALKESGTPAASARTLVIIGDNYSENKNNEDFAFASELIAHGWYDEVELYYGPVGHTHNGVDAQHKIHNINACGYTLGTPADLANAFRDAWHSPNSRPDFVWISYQLNWKARYKTVMGDRAVLNRLQGFARSTNSQVSAHAFRFARARGGGAIEMTFKQNASQRLPWLGADHMPRTNGFRVLRSIPRGAPVDVVPKRGLSKAQKKALTNPKIVEQLVAEGLVTTPRWLEELRDADGAIPFRPLGNARTPGEMGELVEIGAAGRKAVVRRMTAGPKDTFWHLPAGAPPPDFGLQHAGVRPIAPIAYRLFT